MAEPALNSKRARRTSPLKFECDAFSGKRAFAAFSTLMLIWATLLAVGAILLHDRSWQRIVVISGTIGIFVLLWAVALTIRRQKNRDSLRRPQ